MKYLLSTTTLLMLISSWCLSINGQTYLNERTYTQVYNTLNNSYEIKNSSGDVIATKKYNSLTQSYDIVVKDEKSYQERVQIQSVEPYSPDWTFIARAQNTLSNIRKARFDELLNAYQEAHFYIEECSYLAICFNETVLAQSQTVSEKKSKFENDQVIKTLFTSDLSNPTNYNNLKQTIAKYNDDFIELYIESLTRKWQNDAVFNDLVRKRDQSGVLASIPNGVHNVIAFVSVPIAQGKEIIYRSMFKNCLVTVYENNITSIKLDGIRNFPFKYREEFRISQGYYVTHLENSPTPVSIFFYKLY